MQNYWYLLMIACSFIAAIIIVFNQVLKKDSLLFMIYRGFGVFLALLPFAFLFSPTQNPYFYIFCIWQGLVISYFDYKIFQAAKTFGSSITSLIQPISIMFVFVMWFLVHPHTYFDLMENPLKFFLVFCALSSISICIFALKKDKASKEALVYLMPCILCVIAIDITNKQLMHIGRENIYASVYYYTLITSLVVGVVCFFSYKKQGRALKDIFIKKNLLTMALPITILITLQGFLKSYSLHLVSNPAYVTAVLYTSPLWVMMLNKYLLKKDTQNNYVATSKRTIVTLVVSVIILILAS